MRQLLCSICALFFITLTGQIGAQVVGNPPPVDSLCLVFSGIDYGAEWSSPLNYPNAKHITNVVVGSYYFPVVIWETGSSWKNACLFSYWDDQFQFWSYPDSFTSAGGGTDTGRGNVWSDSKGNLHFCWHQAGNTDGYEVFYTRAFLDTSTGVIAYNVERPAVMISAANGEQEMFPSMCLYNDNPFIVWIQGNPSYKHAIFYNYSLDGGNTWQGVDTAYEHGTTMAGLLLPCIAPDPNNGDMWVVLSFEETGDYSSDIIVLHYDVVGGSWIKEIAAVSPYYDYRYYSLPVICVDFSGIPSICFLDAREWMLMPPPWSQDGILLFTRRESKGWSSPIEIGLPENGPSNALSGFPSIGITQNNEIYITCTQPESTSSDTSPYYPFNVYYWKINPELGIFSVPRMKVSEIPSGSSYNAIFPHMLYNITVGYSDNPAITWCQMQNHFPPANLYYKRIYPGPGIEEKMVTTEPTLVSLKISPNPFTTKTEITFSTGQSAEGIEIGAYDVCGRLVKSFSLPTTNSILPTVIAWDGKDNSGRDVPAGVYFVSGRIGGVPVNEKFVCVR